MLLKRSVIFGKKCRYLHFSLPEIFLKKHDEKSRRNSRTDSLTQIYVTL